MLAKYAIVLVIYSFSKLSSLPLPRSLTERFNIEYVANLETKEIISQKITSKNISEEPFYIIDLGELTRSYQQWTSLLPRVKPFYAVKCNPDEVLIKTLASLGAGFDCASDQEISQIISYGVSPKEIIMANPCKPIAHLETAKKLCVSWLTFDNEAELYKIKKHYPDASLILRILPDDSHSLMRFGSKFGAASTSWPQLFETAKKLKLSVIGISFHVGSGCTSAQAFTDAVKLARQAFDSAAQAGLTLTILDIGGGFPGNDDGPVTFKEIAESLSPVLDELFPTKENLQIIAEPGRYMAQKTHILATNIYAKRSIDPIQNANSSFLYYINDGVYGSFNCIFFDHAHPVPFPLKEIPQNTVLYKSKIFGPTCDSLDLVSEESMLPEMYIGDWLFFPNMGAYTTTASSSFNGFKTKTKFYVYSYNKNFVS